MSDKITSVSTELHSKKSDANIKLEAKEASPKDAPKKRRISPEERQQIIDELRLG